VQDWRKEANCKGKELSIFFVEKSSTALLAARVAKEICANCVVKKQCLDFALDNDVRDGIFGGQSPKERRVSKRKRANGLKYV